MKKPQLKSSYNNMYGKKMKLNEYIEIFSYVKQLGPKAKVLDVGCGYGIMLEKFIKNGFGVDNNKEHVKVCKQKGLNVKRGAAEKLPFDDGVFDCVILMEIIEHADDPGKAFREANRVLKKGGVLICTTPSYMSQNAWADITHKRTFSTWGMHSLAIDTGFQVTKLYTSTQLAEDIAPIRFVLRKLALRVPFIFLQKIIYLVCQKR